MSMEITSHKKYNKVFFQVTQMNAVHTCETKDLHDEHWQANTRLIGQLIKDKFKDATQIHTPWNIQDDI